METILHATSLVSAAVVSALVSAVWEGCLLVACVALCLRLLPRLSAASRSVIWMNVFLLLVLLHVVPTFSGHATAGSPIHVAPILLNPDWSITISAVWVGLSLFRAVELLLSAIRLHRLAGRATLVQPDSALQALLAGDAGGRSARLCASNDVERPSVIGFFRPRILIPPSLMDKLSAEELQQVVTHEMEHLRRADDWTNLLQKIVLTLFPLNPVLYWAERRLCTERELACDDRVLRSNCARKAYAICLTRLAEDSILRRSLSLTLGAWERRSELVRRVHRLLRAPNESMGRGQSAFVTASLLLSVLGGAVVLAHSPQFVSFAPLPQPHLQAQAMAASYLRATNDREQSMRAYGGSPQLVKAVMHEPQAKSALSPNPQRRHALKRSEKPRIVENRQAWLVLTEWSDTLPPPRVVIAVDPVNRNSYAAVPLGNGWLIVQI